MLKKFLKSSSNYVEPLKGDSYPNGQQTYYPEQEQSETDLSQLDSQHSETTFQERNPLVYPGEWSNPDWAGGNFTAPYQSDFFNYEKFSPNENYFLDMYEDRWASLGVTNMIKDLGATKNSSVDCFLNTKEEVIKLASINLDDFFKISEDVLIHKSKNDLWKMIKGDDGSVYIKRLFSEGIIKD